MTGGARRGWRHPIFVDLTGQPVVVFGGGTVAERKIEILIQSGARVRVVSPELTDLVARWAETGRIDVERRGYQAGDLAGARLAYAATSDARVNEAIRDEARGEAELHQVFRVGDVAAARPLVAVVGVIGVQQRRITAALVEARTIRKHAVGMLGDDAAQAERLEHTKTPADARRFGNNVSGFMNPSFSQVMLAESVFRAQA